MMQQEMPIQQEMSMPMQSQHVERLTTSAIEKIGLVLPVTVAEKLQTQGIKIVTTVTEKPAIQLQHLQDSLLSCERVNWNNNVCTDLHGVASEILGTEVVTASPIVRREAIYRITEPSFKLHELSQSQLEHIAM